MTRYVSLQQELEEWFDKTLDALPLELCERLGDHFPWSDLSPEQRRARAREIDYRDDAGYEVHRKYWFDIIWKLCELQEEIRVLDGLPAPTVLERLAQQEKIAQLIAQERQLEVMIRRLKTRSFPQYREELGPVTSAQSARGLLMPFSKAYIMLKSRWGATQAEIAAWVFFGPDRGGLRAFKATDELIRFYFHPDMDSDYEAALISCLFLSADVEQFEPQERFVTGQELICTLQSELEGRGRNYLVNKINEGEITDLHPVKGATNGGVNDCFDFPPLETGLYSVRQIRHLSDIEGWEYKTPSRFLSKERPENRKRRLHMWFEEEISLNGKRGALKRTAEREGVTPQTLKSILDRKN